MKAKSSWRFKALYSDDNGTRIFHDRELKLDLLYTAKQVTRLEAVKYLGDINKSEKRKPWRLPTKEELLKIEHWGRAPQDLLTSFWWAGEANGRKKSWVSGFLLWFFCPGKEDKSFRGCIAVREHRRQSLAARLSNLSLK